MSNKTLIPALTAKVGEWNYYICVMKYAQAAKEIGFAFELGGNSDLNTLIQRGISERTKDIVSYLLKSKNRFLGSLIVAAWGGHPQYIPVKMDESDEVIEGLDSNFGVLTFDGSQQYFALDGQHRLKAIKEAIKKNPELGNEEISVILVSHYNTEKGRENTRRLFSNINKNAKSTSLSENIALDEDDGFAIINRQLLTDDEFFKEEGRVSVFSKQGDNGNIKLATSVTQSSPSLLSLKQLYEIVCDLGFELNAEMNNKHIRPSDEVLEESFKAIQQRIHGLMEACGDIESKYMSAENPKDLRLPTPQTEGHPFMRGIVQRSVSKVVRNIIDMNLLPWKDVLERLSKLSWRLGDSPWCSVIHSNEGKVKMLTNRDHKALLESLLMCHLAPQSKQEIKRARKQFSALFGNAKYPISEEELFVNLSNE